MLKRFLVLDLFHANKDLTVNEWVAVDKELPEISSGIFKVKLNNGNEITAYYCQDMCSFLSKYTTDKLSKWWSKQDKNPLYDVTHWGKMTKLKSSEESSSS